MVDKQEEVANDLYEKGQGIDFHALALKIYNAQGDVVKIMLVYDNVGTTSSQNYEYRAYDLIRRYD